MTILPLTHDRQEPTAVTVRMATAGDVDGIVALVNLHARRGNLLPRSRQAISHSLGNWLIAEAAGELLGCVSLLRYTSGLVEVRSLAVKDQTQGRGIGSKLVKALIEEANQRQIPTLFALTRAVGFFQRCGFIITDKSRFPEKVWHDCQKCPLVDNCDETAVVMELMKM